MISKPPEADELEVSVFGPGVGECVVLHLGDGEWVVVDSCVNGESKRPVALDYLGALGVDVAAAVKQVVVTHWHDDHIGGISQLFDQCASAELVLSAALNRKEFFRLIAASQQKPNDELGVSEYVRLFETVRARKSGRLEARSPRWTLADQLLLRTRLVELHALSPSPATFNLTLHEIAAALPKPNESRRRAVALTPNQTAVVLWVQAGLRSVLLGSDLETGSHLGIGWNAIVSSKTRPLGTAKIYKVAHHGSPNADLPELWTTLLQADPIAVVTPFSAGRVARPAPEDLQRLAARAETLLVSARPGGRRDKRRASLERLASVKQHRLRDLRGEMGHVRVRAGSNAAWNVETFGAAYQDESRAV